MPLNAKQRRFAEVYDGNGTQAAKTAGYTGSEAVLATQAGRLLRNAEVAELIMARESKALSKHIATREERQEFWSKMMNDLTATEAGRLRASELLGKSQADFTEKVELKGGLTLEHLVLAATKPSEHHEEPFVLTALEPGEPGEAP